MDENKKPTILPKKSPGERLNDVIDSLNLPSQHENALQAAIFDYIIDLLGELP